MLLIGTSEGLAGLGGSGRAATTRRRHPRTIAIHLYGPDRRPTAPWPGGPEDPLVHLAADAGVAVDEWEEWLLRVVDVERALSLRGYPAEAEGTLVLDVADPLMPVNHGRFRLSVSAGQGCVERLAGTGASDLVLPVAALAPLYTGHLGPPALARMGVLEGSEPGIAKASTLFAGPRPWMADRF